MRPDPLPHLGCFVNPLPEVKQLGQCAHRTRQVVAERLRLLSM